MKNLLPELIKSTNFPYDISVIIAENLVGKIKPLLENINFIGSKILIVCDENTYSILGKKIASEIEAELLILPKNAKADEKNIALITAKNPEKIIAIGSGTINDLCKYASFISGIEYAVFPTAPSMNGYLSANASLTINFYKKTCAAHLPKAVFCDLTIIANAPKRLILSGLGDSLCRPTAQADWLLSHLVLGTDYNSEIFELLKTYEQKLFANSSKLLKGDLEIIELLIKTLLVSGIGMTIAKGSYPASGGEHLIIHTLEMKYGESQYYHGEQIGVTTLLMKNIQDNILAKPLSLELITENDLEQKVSNYFGNELKDNIKNAYNEKLGMYSKLPLPSGEGWGEGEVSKDYPHLTSPKGRGTTSQISFYQDEIQKKINQITLPFEYLQQVLLEAGAISEISQIGFTNEQVEAAISHAKFIRNRFTFLDLL